MGNMELVPEDVSTADEAEAYDSICAIQVGRNHHRLAMKRIAERCKNPEVGRALPGGLFHLRMDEVGNPEIVYNKRTVVVRFVKGGIKVHRIPSYEQRQIVDLDDIIRRYTDYQYNAGSYRGNAYLSPKDVEKRAAAAGLIVHGGANYLHGEEHGDGCPVCTKIEELKETIRQEQIAKNQFTNSLSIPSEIPDDAAANYGSASLFVSNQVIPYTSDNEALVWLSPGIAEEHGKVMKARGWNRKTAE